MAKTKDLIDGAAAISDKVGMFTFAFGAIVAMFFVYIAAKGELPTYLAFFTFTAPAGTPAPVISPSTTNPGPLGGVQGPFGTFGGPGNFPGF